MAKKPSRNGKKRASRAKANGSKGPVLVTGASGFLGRHVVDALLAAGVGPVRTLQRRPTTLLERLGVTQLEGSVTDPDACASAMDGVRYCVHLAGSVKRGRGGSDQGTFDVHVDGTRQILRAAEAAGVARTVHVSTSGTSAVSRDPVIHDETSPFAVGIVRRWPYYLSKLYAEKVALEAAERGQDVVVACPTLLLGPGDEDLSSTQDVLRFLRGELPVVPSGGLSFIDVRDAAAAVVAALERGESGERYLLGAENLDFVAFFRRLERVSGTRGPSVRMGSRSQPLAARALGLIGAVTGLDGDEAASVDMARYFWYLDPKKAKTALGFAPRPGDETLRDTVDWLLSHPHLRPRRGILGVATRSVRQGLGR